MECAEPTLLIWHSVPCTYLCALKSSMGIRLYALHRTGEHAHAHVLVNDWSGGTVRLCAYAEAFLLQEECESAVQDSVVLLAESTAILRVALVDQHAAACCKPLAQVRYFGCRSLRCTVGASSGATQWRGASVVRT